MNSSDYLISVIVPFTGAEIYGENDRTDRSLCSVSGRWQDRTGLFNDEPDEQPENPETSSVISVRFLETDQNRGIHGAGVRGFENSSSGEYVLFLDQDDKIVPDYFVSQLQAIGRGGCSGVCNAVSGGRLKYDAGSSLPDAASRACMVQKATRFCRRDRC